MNTGNDGIVIVRELIGVEELSSLARRRFGDMVKGVVDVRRRIMTLGGDLHADGEKVLLEDGASQKDLWGINIYPEMPKESWVEFDSMINLRPAQNNRSRGVDDPAIRDLIVEIVNKLIQ